MNGADPDKDQVYVHLDHVPPETLAEIEALFVGADFPETWT